MRMRLSLAAVLAMILAIAGVTLASANSNGPSSDDHAKTFTLFAVTVQNADLDLGDSGESLGDRFVFADDLYDKKGGDKVGVTGGECTLVRLDAEARSATVQCLVTFELDGKGQLTVQGLVTFSEAQAGSTFTVPITGGSGDFTGAGGELDVEELSDTEANLTIRLD